MKDRDYLLAVPWRSGLAGWSQNGWAQEDLWDGVNKQENQPHHRNGSSMFDHRCATGILCFSISSSWSVQSCWCNSAM